MIATVPLRRLSAVWIQVTGTWCNLQCTHCLNASGPVDPWLAPMATADVERHVEDATRLGVREVYFTGGEPFLHPRILDVLAFALERMPATVLTNGTLITERLADQLADLATRTRYSLEVRVSLDDPDREANDRVRGRGAFDRALQAIARLHRRGLPAMLTATDLGTSVNGGARLYERLRQLLLTAGVAKPRIKLLPLFPVGRTANDGTPPDSEEIEGYDLTRLQCVDSRTVTADGIYACPILAGLPEGLTNMGGLAAGPPSPPTLGAVPGNPGRPSTYGLDHALGPVTLTHAACRVCVETGASCRNS
jgi:MoaA/NifB/PqqE/SkfB family radical SAM enzyme